MLEAGPRKVCMLVQALITVFVAWLSCSVTAHAQEAPPPLPAGDTNEQSSAAARVHFARGVEHYDEGNFDAALAEIERAYQLEPSNYKLLYNLAQVQMERHDNA